MLTPSINGKQFSDNSISQSNLSITDITNFTDITNKIYVETDTKQQIENINFSNLNKNMKANITDDIIKLATDIHVIEYPISNIRVKLNGQEVLVGGINTPYQCYFSDDDGITPKISGQETKGDKLYWNGESYNLDNNDIIDFIYLVKHQSVNLSSNNSIIFDDRYDNLVIRYSGTENNNSVVSIEDKIFIIGVNGSNNFIWDIGGTTEHEFTYINEFITITVNTNDYNIIYDGEGSKIFTIEKKESSTLDTKRIIIEFDSNVTNPTIEKSVLKYNKDFAFSFGFDDSLSNQRYTAMPLFQGGEVRYKDTNDDYIYELPSSGLTYSDGCGNLEFFKYSCAILGHVIDETTGHYMSIDDMQRIYKNDNDFMSQTYDDAVDWYSFAPLGFVSTTDTPNANDRVEEQTEGFLNDYSYYVASSDGDYNNFGLTGVTMDDCLVYMDNIWNIYTHDFSEGYPTTTLISTINDNEDFIYEKVGFKLKTWSYPSGYHNYQYFIDDYIGVRNRFEGYPDTSAVEDVLDNIHPINLSSKFFTTSKDTEIRQLLLDTKNNSNSNEHHWFRVFTHDIDNSVGTAGGIDYIVFKQFMLDLENSYGTNGDDSILVTSFDKMIEYIDNYNNIALTSIVDGNKLIIEIDTTNCNSTFRENSLSFLVSSDQNIVNITSANVIFDEFSYNITSGLVNFGFKTEAEKAAIILVNAYTSVVDFEKDNTQESKDIAQVNVDLLPIGQVKTDLQLRIDNIVVLLSNKEYYINFTSNVIGHQMGEYWLDPYDITSGTISDYLINQVYETSNLQLVIGNGWEGESGNGDITAITEYPSIAIGNSWQTDIGVEGELKIIGCDNNKYYKLKIACTRMYAGELQTFKVNDEYVFNIDVKEYPEVLEVTNISPINNEISIKTSSLDGNRAYINVLQIYELEEEEIVNVDKSFYLDFSTSDGVPTGTTWEYNKISSISNDVIVRNINGEIISVIVGIDDLGSSGNGAANITIDGVPSEATGDYLYWSGGNTATITIHGLDDNKLYDINLLGLRGSAKETIFTNIESGKSISHDGITEASVILTDISPINKTITISINGSNYHYINWLKVTEK